MVDVPKQIEYWKAGSDEDFAAAESLLEKGHLRHSLFFCHLAIEKMLKAHVARRIKDIPPRIHNLVRLAELAGLCLEAEQVRFLRSFDMYQMEGRYPDFAQVLLDSRIVKEKFALAGEMVESTVITAIRRYITALNACGIHASRLVLFGSFARGNANEFSDIDLVVIAPELEGPRDLAVVEKLWHATIPADNRIEPIPCGEREWETDGSRPILEIARREGIIIAA